jgi:hypothetical protein
MIRVNVCPLYYKESLVIGKEENTILDFEGNSSTYLHYPRLDMIKLNKVCQKERDH